MTDHLSELVSGLDRERAVRETMPARPHTKARLICMKCLNRPWRTTSRAGDSCRYGEFAVPPCGGLIVRVQG